VFAQAGFAQDGAQATQESPQLESESTESESSSSYTLFSPRPRSELRALSTDRPDQTESPFSVDAGHIQVETEGVSYGVTREAGVTMSELHIMNMNVRLGITDFMDFQVVLLPFVMVRAKAAAGPSVGTEGFGDTALRAKINLIGNDDGDFGLGLLPFVTLPTSSSAGLGIDKAEYGLALPMGLALPGEFALGAMLEVDLVNGVTADYVAEVTETLTVGHALIGDLGGFVEVVSTQTFEGGTDASFELHGGLTYGFTPDVQLDGGVFGTLVGSGEDLRGFMGLTIRH
jgi:hypothetical protein